jgi:chaperonin cofactor prefoldin
MEKTTILLLICVVLIVVTFAVKVSLSQNSTIEDPNRMQSTPGVSDEQNRANKLYWTPERRANWARNENEFAAEKIRRREEKDAQKKNTMTINQLGKMVRMGILSPGEASESAKLHGIEYTPEQFANYLPTQQEDSKVVKQLESKINDLNSKYSNTLDSRVDDLERKINDLDDLASRVDDLESKINDLDSKYSRLASRVNDLESKISTLELSR